MDILILSTIIVIAVAITIIIVFSAFIVFRVREWRREKLKRDTTDAEQVVLVPVITPIASPALPVVKEAVSTLVVEPPPKPLSKSQKAFIDRMGQALKDSLSVPRVVSQKKFYMKKSVEIFDHTTYTVAKWK